MHGDEYMQQRSASQSQRQRCHHRTALAQEDDEEQKRQRQQESQLQHGLNETMILVSLVKFFLDSIFLIL